MRSPASPSDSLPTHRGRPSTPSKDSINVEYTNNIHNSEFLAVDPTIMWANPNGMTKPAAPLLPFPTGYAQAQSPVPISTHLHGGEVQSTSDGGPNAWYTANGIHGPDYSSYLPAPANAAWDHYPTRSRLPPYGTMIMRWA